VVWSKAKVGGFNLVEPAPDGIFLW